jgi:hypothetical protein
MVFDQQLILETVKDKIINLPKFKKTAQLFL